MPQFIAIREWSEYQHYKDRDPPWIKLHRKMLTSHTWVTLDDASRVLAIAFMLLAAGHENRIPLDPAYWKRVAYLNLPDDVMPDITPLLRTQFIEIVGEPDAPIAAAETAHASASTPLASDTKRTSETEAEEETDTETEGGVGGVAKANASSLKARASSRRRRPERGELTPLALHASLPLPEWNQWLERRHRKRWPCDELTLSKQLALLAQFPATVQREMIDSSINAGWQGIFPPKLNGHTRREQIDKPQLKSADEIEAAAITRGLDAGRSDAEIARAEDVPIARVRALRAAREESRADL